MNNAQAGNVIRLLQTLYQGARNGLFGNAVFFNELPDDAKPNDISINTTSGVITQYDGENWISVINLATQSELNAHINDSLDAHDADAISYDNTSSGLSSNNAQEAITEVFLKSLQPSDIDTLAELNGLLTDAELIDTNDPRLSDARTPLAHTHTASEVTDFDIEVSNNASVISNTAKRSYPIADENKLATIETNAKDDQTASEVPVVPVGNIASTNVQAALQELQGDVDIINSELGDQTLTTSIKIAPYTALFADDVIITNSDVALYEGNTQIKLLNIRNNGIQSILIIPNGVETIENEPSALLEPGNSYTLAYDGVSNWNIV